MKNFKSILAIILMFVIGWIVFTFYLNLWFLEFRLWFLGK